MLGSRWLTVASCHVCALLQFYKRPHSFILTFGILFCAYTQLKLLSDMLSRFEAVLAVPIYQVSLTLMLITYGNFYFNEMKHTSNARISIFAVALAIIVGGVWMLSLRLPQATQYPEWLQQSSGSKYEAVDTSDQEEDQEQPEAF